MSVWCVCCSTIVSKPKEFAHLIKNRFGSADNITQLSESRISHVITVVVYVMSNTDIAEA